jgi:multisubunit Na+/H+ antiporter MnhG subunit
MPDQFDLELYDVVVYENQLGDLVVHRIVGIEEPNGEHPNERYFSLRGDANPYSDEFPVTYKQMCGIYKGERIANIGSFFAFMRSPAGYLCILLIIIAVIATPILEKKLWEAKIERLKVIGFGPFAKYRVRRMLRFSWRRVFWILFAIITIPIVGHTIWRATLGRSRVMRKLFSPKRRTVQRGKR